MRRLSSGPGALQDDQWIQHAETDLLNTVVQEKATHTLSAIGTLKNGNPNEWTLAIASQGITESFGATVTQGAGNAAVTGTLATKLSNEWTLSITAQSITESAGVTVTQGTGGTAVTGTLKTALQNEWTLAVLNSPIITEQAGVAVTQGTGGTAVTGTLKTTLQNAWTMGITSQSITEQTGVAVTQDEWTFAITGTGITENVGVTVTQGSVTGTLNTALQNEWSLAVLNTPTISETAGVTVYQNEWTLAITSQAIAETAGVAVIQGDSSGLLKTTLSGDITSVVITAAAGVTFVDGADMTIGGDEWTLGITAQSITEAAGVTVSQGGITKGTLKTELTGTDMISVVIETAAGVLLLDNTNIVIGTTPVLAANIAKATKSKAAAKIVFGNINTATQASATGTLKTTLSGGATSVVILCASGVTYSATADTMIGTTNLVNTNINTASNNGATTSVVITTAAGVAFTAGTDITIGSSPVVAHTAIVTATHTVSNAGTLQTTLVGATTNVIIETASGVSFVTTADLIIGSTTIANANINTAQKNAVTNVIIETASGVSFVTTADLIIGSTTIANANINTATNNGATSVAIETASGVIFSTDAAVTIGTTPILDTNINTATNNGVTSSVVVSVIPGVTFVSGVAIVVGSTPVILTNVNSATSATTIITIEIEAGATFVTTADLMIGTTKVLAANINTATTAISTTTFTYEIITLSGSNFGPMGQTWNAITASYNTTSASGFTEVESYDAIDCTVTEKDTEVKCRLAQGAGHSHEWSVIVGKQPSRTPTSSYGLPVLDTIQGVGSIESKTIGGQIVTLHGNNFGPYVDGSKVTYGKDGTEYSPTGCIVVNHQTIQCTTVPGVGFDLFWQIEVRGQRSILNAVNQISPSNPAPGITSYAKPSIASIFSVPINKASAWGSVGDNYRMFLSVDNSGLGDLSTTRIIKFDTEELSVLQNGEDSTRQDGQSELLAFEIPKLYNRKLAQQVPITIFVWKGERAAGVWSKNTIYWNYDLPIIRQIQVKNHPTNELQKIITLIGNNFGNINDGANIGAVNENYRMQVISCEDMVATQGEEITMSFINQPDGAYSDSFIQSWNESASGGRYDKIVLIYKGQEGILRIKRGGQISDPKEFKSKTPVIKALEFYEKATDAVASVGTFNLPTVGNTVDPAILLRMTCEQCPSPPVICPTDPQTTACEGKLAGQPRDFVVFLGSIDLDESELRNCSIVPNTVVHDTSVKPYSVVRFDCYAPSYQGLVVDTRIKRTDSGLYSEPASTSYYKPSITKISRLQGGTTGTDVIYSTPTLLLPTKGYKVKITGLNFGLFDNAKVTWDGYPTWVPGHSLSEKGTALVTTSDSIDFQTIVSTDIPKGVGARLRTVTITTGQFQFDYQDNIQSSTITSIAYRPPTIVDILVPLWRTDSQGNPGGYMVEMYGYDFAPISDPVSMPLSLTTIIYLDTECVITETSYDTIKCTMGHITTASEAPVTTVTVDLQVSTSLTTSQKLKIQSRKKLAKKLNEDETKTIELLTRRTTAFQLLVDNNAVTSGGLAYSMAANLRESRNAVLANSATDYQKAIAATNPTALQLEMFQAINLVQSAMDLRCKNSDTDESTAILDAAILHDETVRSLSYAAPKTAVTQFCREQIIFGPGGDGPSGQAGSGTGGQTIPTIEAVGKPQISLVQVFQYNGK